MEMDIKTLHDAAVENDVTALRKLLEKDPLVLEKTTLNSQDMSPLHVAAMFGNVEFVKEILRVSPDLCLSGDRFERTPLHLAVIKGRMNVLEEIIKARPQAAREKAQGGGNILHLCVKYNQPEALKSIAGTIKDKDFANRKDDEGMTVLHLAVCYGQTEDISRTIDILLKKSKVDVNAKNANGSTALDLCDDPSTAKKLRSAGAKRGSSVQEYYPWLTEMRGSLMIVASLVATMAFQARLTPPGGDSGYYGPFIQANTVAFVSSLSTILLLISGLPFRKKFLMWALMVIMWLTITAIALSYGFSIVIAGHSDVETVVVVAGIGHHYHSSRCGAL